MSLINNQTYINDIFAKCILFVKLSTIIIIINLNITFNYVRIDIYTTR